MKKLKIYLAILWISYRSYTVFFYDIVGKNITFVLRVLIILTLYKAIYKMGGAKYTSYTLEQVGWGLIFVQALVTSRPGVTDEISAEVKSGNIVTYLLNPISYISYKFISNITQYSYNLLINLTIGFILGFLYIGKIHLSLGGIGGSFILLIGAMLIQYFAYVIIGLLAFYTEDIEGFRMIYNFLDRLFGGNILPIPFFPQFLQDIIYLSPFAYTGYTAGLIFAKFDSGKFLYYITVQYSWIVVYLLVIHFIYKNAKKHLVINGG